MATFSDLSKHSLAINCHICAVSTIGRLINCFYKGILLYPYFTYFMNMKNLCTLIFPRYDDVLLTSIQGGPYLAGAEVAFLLHFYSIVPLQHSGVLHLQSIEKPRLSYLITCHISPAHPIIIADTNPRGKVGVRFRVGGGLVAPRLPPPPYHHLPIGNIISDTAPSIFSSKQIRDVQCSIYSLYSLYNFSVDHLNVGHLLSP